jgi:class 3 adenylate cyclase/tetratricopeptide (TPR) repeat protein
VICPSCATDNAPGNKFCTECGASLARACPTCGAPVSVQDKFCAACGSPVAGAPPPPAAAAQPPEAPAAERRLVSVLFADLVGFTSLSEQRDAEDVRELLSRYFDACRRLIELYGGTVEKFIGDAVMAVWGTPSATEDDAERAVRAALDIVAAVAALGDELGAPVLRARAGVLTGEAAVSLGASGQGMVAGDLVNSASRIQSAAEPGWVLVGESTRRATEETVVFESAGSYELKGKDGLVPLWRALRVVSGARGSLKPHGLEAPFVGRDRELRQIKELFHTSAEQRKAHLVSVTGIAGIGKSRLAWEFYKYFDGIAQTIYWHRGRCLAYGEGVTYWALADMVRMRCRIGEDEDPATALGKLRATLDEHLLDADERRFVEPRLAQLLGLAEQESPDRQTLFAAWRLFFERLSDVYPTLLVFEDMHWADASLLDFVEHLLEWSRNHPIFVITLARPELLERRPTWGAGLRNFSSIYLEPLPGGAMHELLAGLVPGLPSALREQILARSEGVPLYAVETVRMLLDRGLLVNEGRVYRPLGEIGALEVPETLHALIAARLDGLAPDERRLLQDGAVLGKSFTRPALADLSGLTGDELDATLAALVRKEVLGVQADPRSPEHGQYGFLQDLVRHVAYETLSRRDRRTRHLAAADHVLRSNAEEEVAEVVAAHLVDAYRAVPDAPDAAEIKERARHALVRAGERAASLAAAAEARRYYEQAVELADDELKRAQLTERAGEAAWLAGERTAAHELFEAARARFEGCHETHAVARVVARLGEVEWTEGQLDHALERMKAAYRVLADDPPDEDLAILSEQLARLHFFRGDLDLALRHADSSLDIAESLAMPELVAHALMTAGVVCIFRNRPQQALALVRHAYDIAREHELPTAGLRAINNLAEVLNRSDRYEDALERLQEGLALARRVGDRQLEWAMLAEMTYPLVLMGRWDEALAGAAQVPESEWSTTRLNVMVSSLMPVYLSRGQLDEAQRVYALLDANAADMQERGTIATATVMLARSEGRYGDALAAANAIREDTGVLGVGNQDIKASFVESLEAAFALGDRDEVERLLREIDAIPRGVRPRLVSANADRFRALLGAQRGAAGDEIEARFGAAEAVFRQIGLPLHLAVTLLEHAEWRQAGGLEASEQAGEARVIFGQLGARPWLERLDAVAAEPPASALSGG